VTQQQARRSNRVAAAARVGELKTIRCAGNGSLSIF
jgi:hypothetical protein